MVYLGKQQRSFCWCYIATVPCASSLTMPDDIMPCFVNRPIKTGTIIKNWSEEGLPIPKKIFQLALLTLGVMIKRP
jgi:hypothetical protein